MTKYKIPEPAKSDAQENTCRFMEFPYSTLKFSDSLQTAK